MNKLFKISIIGCTLFCLLISLAPTSMASNTSYVVHGQIFDHTGANPNGVTITVQKTNVTGIVETLTVITYKDANDDNGTYQINLGDMDTQWSRNSTYGDTIKISASYGGYSGTVSFTIPTTGTIYSQDLTLDTKEGGGGGKKERGAVPGLGAGFEMWFILIIFLLIAIILFAAYMNRKKDR